MQDLATALKAASAEVQQRIFRNMSERDVSMLKEDTELMGPVKLRLV
jgi:flagellar motor switch protein FliG